MNQESSKSNRRRIRRMLLSSMLFSVGIVGVVLFLSTRLIQNSRWAKPRIIAERALGEELLKEFSLDSFTWRGNFEWAEVAVWAHSDSLEKEALQEELIARGFDSATSTSVWSTRLDSFLEGENGNHYTGKFPVIYPPAMPGELEVSLMFWETEPGRIDLLILAPPILAHR